MDRPTLRKPRQHFDTGTRPGHVTLDDGKTIRCNLPWLHYVQARWDHGEPDTIRFFIGNWVVVISGHNLGPLFLAIEEQTLVRLVAHPEFVRDPEREVDTFATSLRFEKLFAFEMPGSAAAPRRKPAPQLDLGLG